MEDKKIEIIEAITMQAIWVLEIKRIGSPNDCFYEEAVNVFNGMVKIAKIVGITDDEIETIKSNAVEKSKVLLPK